MSIIPEHQYIMNRSKSRIKLLGISIDNITMSEAIDRIKILIRKKNPSIVITPNVHHINILQKDFEFRDIYRSASLVTVDSVPLFWLSKILGTPLKERITGVDLLPAFSSIAAKEGYKLFFLGASQGIAKKAAAILMEKNPDLQIVGTYSPPYGFETNERENEKIIEIIKMSAPDVLFVCLGPPKQEKWSWKYKDKLNVPVIICVGAAFDFIAGKVKRAPKWIRKIGLEWFYRLLQEPKRLWKRYLIGNTFFILIALKEIINKLNFIRIKPKS